MFYLKHVRFLVKSDKTRMFVICEIGNNLGLGRQEPIVLVSQIMGADKVGELVNSMSVDNIMKGYGSNPL
jgi:hypothetical protein